MKSVVRNIVLSIGIAFIVSQIQLFLGSEYITIFLKQNLVTLLVALMAINSATLGIVLTKVRELIDHSEHRDGFNKTRKEMLLSIKEQVGLIIIALMVLVVCDSKRLVGYPQVLAFFEVAIIACFVYELIVLYDTATSVFVILDYDS